ncbi:MAG: YggT family protein [Clostridium sp.]
MIIIIKFLSVVQWLIIIDALLSWFIIPRSNAFSRAIGIVIDPIVMPFRKLQDRFMSSALPIDLSPIFAIFALNIIQSILRSFAY